jgi:hypothetical protein
MAVKPTAFWTHRRGPGSDPELGWHLETCNLVRYRGIGDPMWCNCDGDSRQAERRAKAPATRS